MILGLTEKRNPIRTLRLKGEKRNVFGVLVNFEIDVDKVPKKDLEKLKEARDKNDAEAIAKWIVAHGKTLMCDAGVKSFNETYKDVTDKYEKYGGVSVRAWKILLMSCLVAMILGVCAQVLLLLNSVLCANVMSAFLNGALLGYDVWLTRYLHKLMVGFWSGKGL